jgi:hypothetical protein
MVDIDPGEAMVHNVKKFISLLLIVLMICIIKTLCQGLYTLRDLKAVPRQWSDFGAATTAS